MKLTFDDKGYVVTPETVTKGVPVKMEVDLDTVKGCMRTVVINAFNVKQTVKEGATTIEFTPTQVGQDRDHLRHEHGQGLVHRRRSEVAARGDPWPP